MSGKIFGVKIYNFNDDEEESVNILFEKKYDELMTNEHIMEVYSFYNRLNDKHKLHFKIYTECSSTLDGYNNRTFMHWYPVPLNIFLELFCV